jgi:hypothetical protein
MRWGIPCLVLEQAPINSFNGHLPITRATPLFQGPDSTNGYRASSKPRGGIFPFLTLPVSIAVRVKYNHLILFEDSSLGNSRLVSARLPGDCIHSAMAKLLPCPVGQNHNEH